MPSFLHEALVRLFQNRPRLAAELLELVTGTPLPPFVTAELQDPALPDLALASRRADVVVVLRDEAGEPVRGIVVEVQLGPDEDKRLVWPLYLAALAMLHRCPMTLLAVCSGATVAAWAEGLALQIRQEPGILVLGPEDVPRVSELTEAQRSAELMVLSIQAHGHEPSALTDALVALRAVRGLPEPEAVVYLDLMLASLGAAARLAVEELMDQGRYEFQSEYAKRYIGMGKKEGSEEAMLLVARRLLDEGMPVAKVAAITDLSEDQVRRLQH
jgi:hypothetical protein